MDSSKNSNAPHEGVGKLRNFDLTVDEIRVMRSIDELNKTVDRLEQMEPGSSRAKIIRNEIRKLEEELDEIRENTLIR